MSKYFEQSLKEGRSYDQITPIELETYFKLLERLKNEPKPARIKTGILSLDDIMGGFEQGRLYVLSAQTKQGKTTMAQTLLHEMGKQKQAGMIFSYEMGWQEIVEIFGGMDVVDGIKTELPVYVPTELHRGGGDLQYQWLFEAMAKAKEEKNVSVAVIDHLHFLLPLKDFQNTSFIIGGIVRELKRIAVALKMAIILIAHTQKLNDDKPPDWTNIRDSSFITQEADVVLMMYRIKSKEAAKNQTDESTADVYLNKTILSVELNRLGGRTGKVKMRHNGVKFVEMTPEDDFVQSIKKALPYKYDKPLPNY